MSEVQRLRGEIARVTRRGIGMTPAACLYWLGLTGVSAWAGPAAAGAGGVLSGGHDPGSHDLVSPLGWLLNRLCGGDLLARGHPLAGLIGVMAATQVLGWPMLVALFARDSGLLAFALAALLGAHFLPFGWLYRSRAYYLLGTIAVFAAAWLQWRWPQHGNLVIPLAMVPCYALGAGAVWRENRRA